jgi:hypothetical protein
MKKNKVLLSVVVLSVLWVSCSVKDNSSNVVESPSSTTETIFIYPSTENPEEQPFYLTSLVLRQTSSCEEYAYENNVIYLPTTVIFINGELHIKSAGFPIVRVENVGVGQLLEFVETIPCTEWIYYCPETGECFFEREVPEGSIIESDGIISMNEAYELFLQKTQIIPKGMLAYYRFENVLFLDGYYCYEVYCIYPSDDPAYDYDRIITVGYIDIYTGEILYYKSYLWGGIIVLEEYSNGFSQETIDEIHRFGEVAAPSIE